MIAICPNPFRDAELNITRQAVKLLKSLEIYQFDNSRVPGVC